MGCCNATSQMPKEMEPNEVLNIQLKSSKKEANEEDSQEISIQKVTLPERENFEKSQTNHFVENVNVPQITHDSENIKNMKLEITENELSKFKKEKTESNQLVETFSQFNKSNKTQKHETKEEEKIENKIEEIKLCEIAEKNIDKKKEDMRSDEKKETLLMEQSSKNDKKTTSRDKFESLSNLVVGPEIFIQLKSVSITKKYTHGQILGKGSFGTVSLVTQKLTGLIRAMKAIKKSSLVQEEETKIFSELVILKNLDHPHIVKLYELFQDEKNYYLITEYCDGGELFERIQCYDRFSEKMASELMKQILQAVVYCHSQNIVHRDLKPENILFDTKKKNAILKIIDFGTSRKFDPNKKMSKLMGTPYYIAPEVLLRRYTEKCDVWSCGVILYIMLCGYPPFMGATETELFTKIKTGKFKFEERDWKLISNDAKMLIKKMLEVDIEKRISAMDALNHVWIQKNNQTKFIPENTLKNIGKFESTHKIQAAIYTFIVTQLMSAQEKENLQKVFSDLDKNGDGKLSEQELIEAYNKIYGDTAEAKFIVQKILRSSDHNASGKIDYTEFLVAATNREKMLQTNRIQQAFKMFDTDGNGYITKNELKDVMGSEVMNEEVWDALLEECDTNKDGKISYQEFANLLTNKKNLTIELD